MEPEQVERLKVLLGIKDVLAEFVLESAEEIVKNYCHIDAIPLGLSTTILRMATDIYRNEQPGDDAVPVVVKSISEGDTSTSFGAAETTGYSESILKNYKKQLNRYRKVKF